MADLSSGARQSSMTPTKRCRSLKAVSRVRCAELATHIVRAGCVHEHITHTYACDRHVAELESGVVHCVQCYRLDQHTCRLLGRAEPFEVQQAARG